MLKLTNRKGLRRSVRVFSVAVAAVVFAVGCGEKPTYEYPPPKPKPDPPDPPVGYVWTELPEFPDEEQLVDNGGHLQIITHWETFGGDYTRNFTMLYDRVEKVSHWVAYPMHKVWIDGSGSRDNIYRYDPQVPKGYQASATTEDGHGYGIRGIERGHQIAAADRNSSQEANIQTFYITNMTPQNGDLNGGREAWAGLETWVRTRAKESGRQDTLYVVSGCWLGENPAHIANRNNVAIPEAYYKVLLRTARRNQAFPSDNNCELIGFWYENETPADDDHYREHTMSVEEIERRTGFDFFPSISNDAQNRNDDPSRWNGL